MQAQAWTALRETELRQAAQQTAEVYLRCATLNRWTQLDTTWHTCHRLLCLIINMSAATYLWDANRMMQQSPLEPTPAPLHIFLLGVLAILV